MSTSQPTEQAAQQDFVERVPDHPDIPAPVTPSEPPANPAPERYTRGSERYVRFAAEILGQYVTGTQRLILRSVAENQRTYAQAGNGVGKSYTGGLVNLAFLLSNVDSIEMATSGSYSVLSDVLWKPMQAIFKKVRDRQQLPGRMLQNPPRLIIDDEWFFKCVSPTHPDNLEGRHAGTMLITMEECDKPDISEDHFDSAGSMITDGNDRFLAIGNPPKDEANVAYKKFNSDRWSEIWFSSFDSHNVLVDAGELDAPKIEGLVDLDTIKDDWREWNQEEWPGFEAAKHSYTRTDLDQRWYRRRLGLIPPTGSRIHRPIYAGHVRATEDRFKDLRASEKPLFRTHIRRAIGVDIGHEGGDLTTVAELVGPVLDITESKQHDSHSQNEDLMRNVITRDPIDGWVAIDAIGEGSGPADTMCEEFNNAFRFKANSNPADSAEYYDKKSEAYALLGQFIRDGGIIADSDLRDELYAAARSMEFTERHKGSETVLLTDKSPVKAQLGHSPDRLDAAAMAVWVSHVENPHKTAGSRSRMFNTRRW